MPLNVFLLGYMMFQSLSFRLKSLTALWLSVAIVSISLTLHFSWRLEGGAGAINDVGSLRMQTYRLGLLLNQRAPSEVITQHIQKFDDTLYTLQQGDPTRPLFLPDDAQVQRDMLTLTHTWQHDLKPRLQTEQTIDAEQTVHFIQQIDYLTSAVEKINAQYIQWLRFFQMGLLVLVMVSAIIMVRLLYLWILNPLEKLQNAVNAVHNGQLGTQIPLDNLTEFAQVDKGFNQMSVHLQQLYDNLEQQVAEKTQDLEQKNYTLQTLYFFSHFLNQAQTTADASEVFLEKIMTLIPAQAGSIRLIDLQRQRLDLIAQHGLPEPLQTAEACQRIEECLCGQAVQLDNWQPIYFHANIAPTQAISRATCHNVGFHYLRVFKISYNGQELGMMTLYFAEEYDFGHVADLVESLCHQLGSAVSHIRLAEESRQLAVLQERNLMAQGLHDSIAQTLTFLNLQTQMLESALKANEQAQIHENVQFIKEGVQECYEDVRELLLNFRTKITRKDFNEAITTLVQRFQQQTHIEIDVQWHGEGYPLNSEQQLQYIFILQESLSNIRKHAQANRVNITFHNDDDFTMTITDNGRGFNPDYLSKLAGNHVGLNIMRERAGRIQAQFSLESQLGNGTRIQLTLPKSKRIVG